jgi:hypothetical protein
LPLYIAKFAQSFPKLLFERLRVSETYVERPYSSHLGRWLRARQYWPHRRGATERNDEIAAPHYLASGSGPRHVGFQLKPSQQELRTSGMGSMVNLH